MDRAEFDLSQIPPVKAIMAGQTGVIRFYSPAYHAGMITVYTSVPETKWGVMVPQPMDELYAQAEQVRSAAVAISFSRAGGGGDHQLVPRKVYFASAPVCRDRSRGHHRGRFPRSHTKFSAIRAARAASSRPFAQPDPGRNSFAKTAS
jgi:hypothetical protein